VLVVGRRTGTVKFFGTTHFAPGYWYGIELEKPHGKNDGSVGGVQYFSCSPRYGIFAPPSRVQRVTDSLDTLSEISSNKQNHSYPGFRRSFSTTSASSQKEINRRNAFANHLLLSSYLDGLHLMMTFPVLHHRAILCARSTVVLDLVWI